MCVCIYIQLDHMTHLNLFKGHPRSRGLWKLVTNWYKIFLPDHIDLVKTYIYIYIYLYIHMYTFIYIYRHICVDIYIYDYIYIYEYTVISATRQCFS